MAAGAKPDTAAPPQAPSAAKGVFMRRIFPFLLATNVFIGVYVFAKTYKRDQEKKNAQTTAAAALSSPASTSAEAPDPAPAPAPKSVLPPLSEDEQWNLYKWILEEERKIKPRNATEKKKIAEEKALLKEIIRDKSLPRL
ncbi:hypothetical protein Zm00014a_004002 [Zea mays]|uniref:Uncharacterized protein n=2 Tax=Zea mays TaxID=4577 RepID=B6TGU0_MAIZE|nr:uncharacterized protein LOC100276707 [Zea mays]ACG36323.1 hypothetical protein [Zea mays]PWZ10124.1 hypothetical protein Zm00014a_004002 [Zea mays]|eukprot:NP_001143903.1 uncharacterized protein LOC100276707 [Zea mays]